MQKVKEIKALQGMIEHLNKRYRIPKMLKASEVKTEKETVEELKEEAGDTSGGEETVEPAVEVKKAMSSMSAVSRKKPKKEQPREKWSNNSTKEKVK